MKNDRRQQGASKQHDIHEFQPDPQSTPAMSRHEIMEAHLLDVAATQFASAGYRQTTLETIAQHAGLSKASMYRYVANKQELLCKIFVKVGATFAHALEPMQTALLPPQEKLRRAVHQLLRIISENVALFTVFYKEESDLPPRLHAQITEVRQRNAARLEDILREGIERGVFRAMDTRLVVQAILGMCTWLHKWYRPNDMCIDDVATAFLGLIEKGCHAPCGTGAQDSLADQLRHMQETLGHLVERAEQLEKTTVPVR
jgi:TetR/AcrR family transcriptional regulator, cholesterol catabolism regulator